MVSLFSRAPGTGSLDAPAGPLIWFPGLLIGDFDMAVPKKKISRSRRGNRRSHHALSEPGLSVDKQTKSIHRPHHVELKTGFYRGKPVLFQEDVVEESTEASEE